MEYNVEKAEIAHTHTLEDTDVTYMSRRKRGVWSSIRHCFTDCWSKCFRKNTNNKIYEGHVNHYFQGDDNVFDADAISLHSYKLNTDDNERASPNGVENYNKKSDTESQGAQQMDNEKGAENKETSNPKTAKHLENTTRPVVHFENSTYNIDDQSHIIIQFDPIIEGYVDSEPVKSHPVVHFDSENAEAVVETPRQSHPEVHFESNQNGSQNDDSSRQCHPVVHFESPQNEDPKPEPSKHAVVHIESTQNEDNSRQCHPVVHFESSQNEDCKTESSSHPVVHLESTPNEITETINLECSNQVESSAGDISSYSCEDVDTCGFNFGAGYY